MSSVQQTLDPISESPQGPTESPRHAAEHAVGVFRWDKSQEERHDHVMRRAEERAELILSFADIESFEAEIGYVRSITKTHLPKPKALATLVAHDWQARLDFYAVLVGAKRHVFVWCRECNGLVSYAMRQNLVERISLHKRVRRRAPTASNKYTAPPKRKLETAASLGFTELP